ncbi:MAG: hypothetical protein KGJ05_08990, partial [Alphaproteobacteria bacterium]|nr:hypothetical protein [Alphaproteobacteria bacterium]
MKRAQPALPASVQMPETVVLIGFGEAGSTFAHAALWGEKARVYDLLSARSRVATLVAAVEGA